MRINYLFLLVIDKGQHFLVIEWADRGNLEEYLGNEFQSLTLQEKLKLAKGIADGLKYLHERKIIHRDLVSNYNNENKMLLLFILPIHFSIQEISWFTKKSQKSQILGLENK